MFKFERSIENYSFNQTYTWLHHTAKNSIGSHTVHIQSAGLMNKIFAMECLILEIM